MMLPYDGELQQLDPGAEQGVRCGGQVFKVIPSPFRVHKFIWRKHTAMDVFSPDDGNKKK